VHTYGIPIGPISNSKIVHVVTCTRDGCDRAKQMNYACLLFGLDTENHLYQHDSHL
jgi:hypothetical protein